MNDEKNIVPGFRSEVKQIDIDNLPPLNIDQLVNECIISLLAAIIRQGFKDYHYARIRFLNASRHQDMEFTRKKALYEMAEAEDFLLNTDIRLGLEPKTAEKIGVGFKKYQSTLPELPLTEEERLYLEKVA